MMKSIRSGTPATTKTAPGTPPVRRISSVPTGKKAIPVPPKRPFSK